jgi:two-component system, chemotaxis family, chemotaxis protein CheY
MKKILVVDDSIFIRMRLKGFLEEHQFDVVEAEDGEVAIEKFASEKPDLTLLDIGLPKMDGIEVLESIRKQDPDAIVIILSGVAKEETLSKAMLLGAKEYLIKPFDEDKMIEKIRLYFPI